MKVGLLIVATEILEGKIVDLNGRHLAEFLREHQLELDASITVRDEEIALHRGLDYLCSSCDLIITSGGLGPTPDDLTKDSLARYLGRKSSYSHEAQQVALGNYERFGRVYPGGDHPYSKLPDDFVPLPNATGLAPMYFVKAQKHNIFMGPGVPREFKSLLADHLGPWLAKNYSPEVFQENFIVKTKKVPEEKIFGELDPSLWKKLEAYGSVSSLPNIGGVDIGVKVRAKSREELITKKEELKVIFESSPVASAIWHFGPINLEEAIVAMANQNNFTFATAESCTGGLIANRITNVPGSSKTFIGGIVSYANLIKEKHLGVRTETLKNYGAVSLETAEEMVRGVVRELGVEFAVATTGIAGPTGGSTEKPVGLVCIGVYAMGQVTAHRLELKGDRVMLKERFAQSALILLFEAMTNAQNSGHA